jgi:beta-ureidopropionase / N-carbamoyl-L-amino-acid hydrolase
MIEWSELRVNASRLQRCLEELSVFGRPVGGTFADGITRVAFSEADLASRRYVIELMRAARLDTWIDAAGNIIGHRKGRDTASKPIVFGSHIDSVPCGGNFDGQLGCMASIELIRILNEHDIWTHHPLEVAVWSNEEDGMTGSRAVLGELSRKALDHTVNGVRVADGLRRIGGDPDRLNEACRARGSIESYLELHIEQGSVLESARVSIGVVDGIVSIDAYEVDIHGFQNHAGTTSMRERRNALLAAAKIIQAVETEVTRFPGPQVGTVGHLDVFPNARNVVPGWVKHSVELRELSEDTLHRMGEAIRLRVQEIATETRTEIAFSQIEHNAPALAAPDIQQHIEAAASGLGLQTMRLTSGAGHDAQMLSKLGPMGMIFVPSVDGISHSPKELSTWNDCSNGANVLLHTVLRLDRAR